MDEGRAATSVLHGLEATAPAVLAGPGEDGSFGTFSVPTGQFVDEYCDLWADPPGWSERWQPGAMVASLRCEVFSADLDATASFYVEVLGFTVVRDERAASSRYLSLVRDEVRVGAAARAASPHRDQRRPPVGVELVLEVEDLDSDRARVRAAGWPVVEDVQIRPWGLRDFRLLDPDGYYWRVTHTV